MSQFVFSAHHSREILRGERSQILYSSELEILKQRLEVLKIYDDNKQEDLGPAGPRVRESQRNPVGSKGWEGGEVERSQGGWGGGADEDRQLSCLGPECYKGNLGRYSRRRREESQKDGGDGGEACGDGQEEQRGGEAVEAGRRPRRPQPPEVSERQVLHHRRQGEQGDQIRERTRGGGDLSCEARGGAGGDEAGGQSGEGGYQVLPSHQVRADPSVLGLQDWISLRPGCQRGEAGQGTTIEGDLHQLCVDEQTSLHPLRGAPARQGEDVGEVLRRQRRQHLRPAEGELRQLGLRQGEADFSERRSCLGRGRRSQPQQHRVDGDSRRGEVTVLQQLEDSKNLQIVIPTFVPEAWYSIPSLSSEFGKMLAPCMPLISKSQISKNMVAKLKLKGQDDDVDDNVDDDVDDDDDDDDQDSVGQAYQLGMMMGAEINV